MSGVMVSLTPLFKPTVDRPIAFHEYAEVKDVDDVIQKLNVIPSKPTGFPQIPAPRKDCMFMTFPIDQRSQQYVMCPEQDCESLVYYGDQSRSMIDVHGLGQEPFWYDRVKDFYKWYAKSASKTGQMHGHGKAKTLISGLLPEALPRETSQFQQIQLIAPILKRRHSYGETLVISIRIQAISIQARQQMKSAQFQRMTYLSKENQQAYMQRIEKILDLDQRTSKDPRLYCGYCNMNNHPRFARKHAYKHQKPSEKHRCTLCTAFHPPFCCSRAQINGGSGKPNWSRIEYKPAKQESREPDLRCGVDAAPVQPDFPTLHSQSPNEAPQPTCAATAMMHGFVQGSIEFVAGRLSSNR